MAKKRQPRTDYMRRQRLALLGLAASALSFGAELLKLFASKF